ncbi:MAG: hypothetical protein JXX29_04295 [Deltaproteobacteria bacterium]|nr:hypothetical protein [Deltaproteobacteria bacterium]
MRKVLMVLMIPLVVGFSASAAATTLSGKISVSKKFMEQLDAARKETEKAQVRGYWNEPNGIRPVAPVRFDLSSDIGVAIYMDGAKDPKPDPVLSLNVLTGSLEKNVVVIRPQSRIKFIMKSPFDHELYAPGKHDFKPQKQGNNSFRPIDFYSAGVFEVKCKLFPHFQGWVVATPATHVPEVNKSGAFTVEDMEEGKYTLKVFFRGKWIVEKKFEVSGKKQEIAVTLNDVSGKAESSEKDEKEEPQKAEAKKEGDNAKEAKNNE